MKVELLSRTIRFWCLALYAVLRMKIISLTAPVSLMKTFKAYRQGGASPSILVVLAAARYPHRIAIADEAGEISFLKLYQRMECIAGALHAQIGLGTGQTIGIMCRNHRGFVEATLAGGRLGCNLLFLNTAFPGPQLKQVLENNHVDALIYDELFLDAVKESGFEGCSIIAWHENKANFPTLDELAVSTPRSLPRVARPGRLVVLTSGTTGLPKGAARIPRLRAVLSPFVTLLLRLPLRRHMPAFISIPLFHGFGLAAMFMSLALAAPMILRQRFDAKECVHLLRKWQIGIWVVVPLMLRRVLAALPAQQEFPGLKAIACGGASISPNLVAASQKQWPDRLFNLYGTSEAGFACMAAPDDLRQWPTTVGYAGESVELHILDIAGNDKRTGEIGRVHIGGPMVFDGYDHQKNTHQRRGGTVTHGWIDTGDLGYLDAAGRLFLRGRADAMIVSGAENVFPIEVENVLLAHSAVEDAAVIPVEDAEFGQCLRAYVVIKTTENALTPIELKQYLQERIARYKVPAQIILVANLPRNILGKLAAEKSLGCPDECIDRLQ